MKDPHGILGVPEDATVAEIKESYRRLSEQLHPDQFKSEEQKLEAEKQLSVISRAYHLLIENKEGDEPESVLVPEDPGALPESFENLLAGPEPAPFFLRIIASCMDGAFIFFAGFLFAQALFPNEISNGMETYDEYGEKFKHEKDVAKLKELSERFQEDPVLLEMVITLLSSWFWVSWCYWFVGERYFKGCSLGKRMFLLSTLSLRTGDLPETRTCFTRAFIKSLPILVLFPLLTLMYLMPLFNQRRMAGHDFLSRTMVVRGHLARKTREDSTNPIL